MDRAVTRILITGSLALVLIGWAPARGSDGHAGRAVAG
jgi:hypothetical protein